MVTDIASKTEARISVMVVPDMFFQSWSTTYYSNEVVNLHTLTEQGLFSIDKEGLEQASEIFEKVFSDERSFYIMERVFKYNRRNSVFNKSSDIIWLILNTLNLIKKYEPEKFVFPSTPHSLEWFMAKVAEFVGVKVVHTPVSPLSWKRHILEGLDEKVTRLKLKEAPSNFEDILNWYNRCKQSYDLAIPSYERDRYKRYEGADRSLMTNIYDILLTSGLQQKLRKLRELPSKLRALKIYEELAYNFEKPRNYVVYFLHFQPERTSLPEGLNYSQQLKLIIEISLSLPKDYILVVKEHPSMFRNIFNSRVRETSFYVKLGQLQNVVVAPLSLDSFNLLDSSLGVITLTGTVGLEACIRGKPILAMGAPQYFDLPCLYTQFDDGLFRFIKDIELDRAAVLSQSDILKYLHMIDLCSYPTDHDSFDAPSAEALIHAIDS